MSNLSAIEYIANPSEGTTGLWNQRFSVISANFAAINSDATRTIGSGNTLSVLTNLETSGGAHFQFLSVGSTPPSYVTTAAVTVRVNSNQSDYLYLTDSAAQRSSYVIGSRAGGTADGLNIWDASAGTMIASFSKQSVRFYQNVVGPVFDTGGALTDTLNAATFGTGANSVESRVQAAISAASIAGITRVYVPASLYPYSAQSISFDTRVQMVREGGEWTVFDVIAYGANGNGSTGSAAGNTAAIQSAISGANADPHSSGLAGGVVYFPPGRYAHDKTLRMPIVTNSGQVVLRGANMRVSYLFPLTSVVTAVLMGTATPDPSGTVTNQTLLCGIEDLSISGSLTTDTICGVQFTEVQKGWIRNSVIENLTQGNSIGLYLRGSTTVGVGASSAPHNWRCGFWNVWITATVTPLLMQNVEENDFYNCNFNANVGRASATTAVLILQGRNNRFYGTLIGGDSSSITTGRPNYTGLALPAPTQGNNEGHQFYGVFGEGFDSVFSFASPNAGGPQNVTIEGYAASTNRLEITDAAANNTVFIQRGGLVVPLYQYADGSHAGPAFAFRSDGSLGWFRSAQSTMALSQTGRLIVGSTAAFSLVTQPEYGFGGEPTMGILRSGGSQMDFYANSLRLARIGGGGGTAWIGAEDGSSTTPSIQFNSEVSLGFYRSGASVLAMGPTGRLLVGSTAAFSLATQPEYGFGGEPQVGFRRSGAGIIQATSNNIRVASFGVSASAPYVAIELGSTTTPSLQFINEPALGFLRSVVSTIAISRGALAYPDGSATTPSITYSSNTNLGLYSSGVQTIAQSQGTLNLAKNAVRLSMRTLAASSVTLSAGKTNVAVDEAVWVIGGASGASLLIYSGGTLYGINSTFSLPAA